MNPYEEVGIRSHHAELSRETRALQLSGQSGAALESERELFSFATLARASNRVQRFLAASARWRPAGLRASRALRAAPRVRPTTEPVLDVVVPHVIGESAI